MSTGPCPLCRSTRTAPLAEVSGRRYAACPGCKLGFMLPADRPSAKTERAVYDLHENDSEDPRYRAFLDRLARPLAVHLRAGARGLDYGAGPGPALAAMLTECGFPTAIYDPFYAPDTGGLERRYDFVACTETAEHFHDPAVEFARIDGLLKPGGWLGLMTQWRLPGRDFAGWRYVRDPTHVCFYGMRTLEWIAGRFGWQLELPAANVALFRKPGAGNAPAAGSGNAAAVTDRGG